MEKYSSNERTEKQDNQNWAEIVWVIDKIIWVVELLKTPMHFTML